MNQKELSFSYTPFRLKFKEPGGTSRGVLTEKLTFLIRVCYEGKIVYGEVPVFPGLSKETPQEVEASLEDLRSVTQLREIEYTHPLSSVTFGLQQITSSLENLDALVFPSEFTEKKSAIKINGLIWMGDAITMKRRADAKLKEGFECIKIKIGAINWEEEVALLAYLRERGGAELTIRVDANGAFSPEDYLSKMDTLSRLGIHSIEQPIKAGSPEQMSRICRESPVPVALDEELIGLPIGKERSELLEFVSPRYIILKPALCYGFKGASDWIERAEKTGIGWWVTSALESSVGLNALAQFVGTFHSDTIQGLGTGGLYTNNFASPLRLKGENLHYVGISDIYSRQLEHLDWK